MGRGKNKRQEGVVRAVGRGGDGVVETPGGLWFVPDVLPAERVRVRQADRRGGATRGEPVAVLEASADRVAPECAHQRRCGGCPLMHASTDLEARIKRGWLEETLQRLGAGALVSEWFAAPDVQRYRGRARLFWQQRGRGPATLGLRRARSQQVVDIPDCLVLDARLDGCWGGLRERVSTHLRGEGEVALALGASGLPTVVLRAREPQPPELYAALAEWVDAGELAGAALQVGEGTQPASWGEPSEEGVALDGEPLRGTVGGFSQANPRVNQRLVQCVRELAETRDARVHELYAGHGNFTVALASGSGAYTAVEQSAEAAERCEENLKARGLAAKVVVGAAEEHVGSGPLDVLVLDPPRTGARGVLRRAAARKPARIVYVSCNLATLERDVAEAIEVGYALDYAAGFDMFPRTAQLETVVRLVRR